MPHVFAMCRSHCSLPSTDCIKPLVTAGFDVNHQDHNGATILHYLCGSTYYEDLTQKVDLIEYLLDHGADWALPAHGLRGDTVLHRLARIADVGTGFNLLIRKIARECRGNQGIAAVNEDGDRVLSIYLSMEADLPPPGGAETAMLLAQAGCSLNVLNKKGRAVAHHVLSVLLTVEWVDILEGLGMDLSLPDSEEDRLCIT
ncbi:hypothetical protein BJX62DRAFT_244838 [Aspergillus germanicus]